MTENEMKAMTVVQLRKTAKDLGITLGAGIDKAGIIQKILEHTGSGEVAPAAEETESTPKFQAAWHNVDAPRYASRPAYQAPVTPQRPAWQNTTPSGQQVTREQQRVQPVRPGTFTPRFGPAPSMSAISPAESAAPAPASAPEAPASPLPERRLGESSGYTSRFSAPYTGVYTAPPVHHPEMPSVSPIPETSVGTPTLEELLASGECEDGSGVLELHPDGYGFLRAPSFLPSTKIGRAHV